MSVRQLLALNEDSSNLEALQSGDTAAIRDWLFVNDSSGSPVVEIADNGSGVHLSTRGTNENLVIAANGTGSTSIEGLAIASGGISGAQIKDEDDMSSDSATHLATQQSIKAYVDAAVGGGGTYDAITDPALNAAVTTAKVDAYGGTVITLTAAGNNQTLQDPTATGTVKEFWVVNAGDSTDPIDVIGGSATITLQPGEAQKFIWDKVGWTTGTGIDAGEIDYNPASVYLSTTNLQSTLDAFIPAVAGTAEASKALAVDANLDIGAIRNLAITGSLTIEVGESLYFDGGSGTYIGINSGDDLRIYQDSTLMVRYNGGESLIYTTMEASSAGGWGLVNEDSSSSNPNILPDKSDTGTGLGYDSGILDLIGFSGVRTNKSLYMAESATALTDMAGYGQIWVKSDTPNTLWFTDDAGTDWQLNDQGVSPTTDLSLNIGTKVILNADGSSDTYIVGSDTLWSAYADGSEIIRAVGAGRDVFIDEAIVISDLAIASKAHMSGLIGVQSHSSVGSRFHFVASSATMTNRFTGIFTETEGLYAVKSKTSNNGGVLAHHVSDGDYVAFQQNILMGTQTPTGEGFRFNIAKWDGGTSADPFADTETLMLWTTDNIEKGRLYGDGSRRLEGSILMAEKAAGIADQAGYGQVWVKNDTPNTLWYTDDAGTDWQLNGIDPTADIDLNAGTRITFDENIGGGLFMLNGSTHELAFYNNGAHTANMTTNGLEIKRINAFDNNGLAFYDNGGSSKMVLADTSNGAITLRGGTSGIRIQNFLYIAEQAAASTDIAGQGQWWVKNDVPNIPMFTDDAGTDYNLALSSGTTGGASSAGAGNQYIEITVAGTTYKVLHDGTV